MDIMDPLFRNSAQTVSFMIKEITHIRWQAGIIRMDRAWTGLRRTYECRDNIPELRTLHTLL